ncbi:MAG TPA: hypothetical protein VH081_04565 [Solirubrobacteraceae bacterium]|jgi:hypothetical protein|nr:hypothetical protein [Solirubrobacteraceae bacterium]
MSPAGRRPISPPQSSAPRRRRGRRLLLIAIGVLVFLVISGLLARFLTTDNLEREDDLALIQAEARGDSKAMLDKLSACRERAVCVADVQRSVSDPRLRRPGAVKILSLTAATANSPTGATGKTRLAWTVLGEDPIVQCIDVRRTGNALTGVSVKLLSISAPIENEGDC